MLRESSDKRVAQTLSLWPARFRLSMVRRHELVGFLAVAEKTDRTLYRPDEIENLLRTVHQVSTVLYALQLERFQQRSHELEQQNEALREELRSIVRPHSQSPREAP